MLQKEGIIFDLNSNTISVKYDIKTTMIDRKASNLYLDLGGAYCDLCSLSKEECRDLEDIQQGFIIDRSIESINEIFSANSDDSGVIRKHGDYHQRAGLTQEPIASESVTIVQVLHGLLRSFDFFTKIIYHLKAEVLDRSESKTSIYTKFIKEAKSEIQTRVYEHTGIKLDFPNSTGRGGTTTTGNVARRLLYNSENRNYLIDQLPEKFRCNFRIFAQSLSIILRIINSTELVKVEVFKMFCIETYRFLIQNYSWVSVTPTIHKVLGHSWEVIEQNGSYGLGNLSEEGMEGCNKITSSLVGASDNRTSLTEHVTLVH